MSCLTSLMLEWKLPDFGPQLIIYPHPTLSLDQGICLPHYNEVTPGTMLRIVHQTPCLAELDMRYVRIPLTEVVAILKHVGKRLRIFGVCFHDQCESSVDRFKTIVETIIEYNQELRTVAGRGERCLLSVNEIDTRRLNEIQLQQVLYGKNLLCDLLWKMRNSLLCLDIDHLISKWVRAVQWIDGC